MPPIQGNGVQNLYKLEILMLLHFSLKFYVSKNPNLNTCGGFSHVCQTATKIQYLMPAQTLVEVFLPSLMAMLISGNSLDVVTSSSLHQKHAVNGPLGMQVKVVLAKLFRDGVGLNNEYFVIASIEIPEMRPCTYAQYYQLI